MASFILWGLVVAVVSYLLGSMNFPIIITKLLKKGDIRDYGSGNAGSTNVLRSVGKKAALVAFLLDIFKAVVSVLIGYFVFSYVCESQDVNPIYVSFGKYIGGLACMLGHIFPLYYGFKGGKGVATSGGMIAVLDWRVFIIVILSFITSFMSKKIVSLSSIIAACIFPLATFLVTYIFDYTLSASPPHIGYLIGVTAMSFICGMVVVVKHKDNIKRLREGTEKPIIKSKS